MNTRGSVRELPKVQAAVVSSRAPAAHSHSLSRVASSSFRAGGQLTRHEAAAPAIPDRAVLAAHAPHKGKGGLCRALLAMMPQQSAVVPLSQLLQRTQECIARRIAGPSVATLQHSSDARRIASVMLRSIRTVMRNFKPFAEMWLRDWQQEG